jgi:transposase
MWGMAGMMRGHDDTHHGRATGPDEVWDAIQPLLPATPPHPKGGRPWLEDRAVLGGII